MNIIPLAIVVCAGFARTSQHPLSLAYLCRVEEHRFELADNWSVHGIAEYSVWNEHAVEGKAVAVNTSIRGGRMLVRQTGHNLFGLGDADKPTSLDVTVLHTADGGYQSFDHGAAFLQQYDGPRKDVRLRRTSFGPSEFIWSFSGQKRSELYAKGVIAAVAGDAPQRIVEIHVEVGSNGNTRHRVVFRLNEAWGFLASLSQHSILCEDGNWVPVATREVIDVHRTRMGYYPRSSRYVLQRVTPKTGAAVVIINGVYVWDAPVFSVAELPRSLFSDEVGKYTHDPLYASKSFLTHAKIWNREGPLRTLLERATSLVSAAGTPRAGRLSWVVYARWIGCVLLGVLVILLWRSRRFAWAGWGMGATSLMLWLPVIWSGFWTDTGVRSNFEDVRIPWPSGIRSVYLCGVDCLYAAGSAIGSGLSYPLCARLVRPGSRGCRMDDIEMAASCLGLKVTSVDCASYSEPSTPLIMHINGAHFVCVLGPCGSGAATEDSFVVWDPSVGVRVMSWSAIRGGSSRRALSLAGS